MKIDWFKKSLMNIAKTFAIFPNTAKNLIVICKNKTIYLILIGQGIMILFFE